MLSLSDAGLPLLPVAALLQLVCAAHPPTSAFPQAARGNQKASKRHGSFSSLAVPPLPG